MTPLPITLLAAVAALGLVGCNKSQPETSTTSATGASVTAPSPSANNAVASHSAYLAAAESFESLTEQAASATPEKLTSLVADAEKVADVVLPVLGAAGKSALGSHLSKIRAALRNSDRTAIALAAVEGYRTLVESADETGSNPRAVSLLDYAGFRYQADLAAWPPRWSDAASAETFAEVQWSGIADKVTDTGLKSDFARALADMKDAAKSKNTVAAKSVVIRELDLVDKLEQYFAK